jgi:hypothetical protein
MHLKSSTTPKELDSESSWKQRWRSHAVGCSFAALQRARGRTPLLRFEADAPRAPGSGVRLLAGAAPPARVGTPLPAARRRSAVQGAESQARAGSHARRIFAVQAVKGQCFRNPSHCVPSLVGCAPQQTPLRHAELCASAPPGRQSEW